MTGRPHARVPSALDEDEGNKTGRENGEDGVGTPDLADADLTAGPSRADVARVRAWLLGLQSRIVEAMEQAGGEPFERDAWTRPPDGPLAGDGVARVIEGGALLERGGCNFSHVSGRSLPPSATAGRPELAGASFEALGVSLVFHPRNPYVPTVHMNVRMFCAFPPDGPSAAEATDAPGATRAGVPVSWFGGGMDLTPYYGFAEDARHFHATCRDALAPFGEALHPRFKTWCDEYFFLKHRGEARGIGGIFFDDFAELGFERGFEMLRAVADAFLVAWLPIVERRRALPYGERERDFQAVRRGRYVEFNLVWDRGTHFGLQSGGRTEAILMSLPPGAAWRYDWAPDPASSEAALTRDFLPVRDWLADEPLPPGPLAGR